MSFIKLNRRYFLSDLWREPREFSKAEAWLDLIQSAAFAPETTLIDGRCLNLQPGELVASVRYLGQRWGWSKSKVERFLILLRKANRIETGTGTPTGTATSVIRLCNYEKYNHVRDSDRDTNGDSDRDGPETPPGQSIRTKKNDEEIKEQKNFSLVVEKTDHYHKDARAALHILNEAAGTHYREVDSNLTIISARLREPEVTIDGVRTMIQRQCRRWKGTPQAEYLRPETLFGKTKFDSYYANRDMPVHDSKPVHRPESNQIQELIDVPNL